MREYVRPSHSSLFAIELLSAAGVFILCAAICIGLFVRAEIVSASSADLNRAVEESRNAAECWKAAGGDLAAAAALCGEAPAEDALRLYYDKDWTRCSAETQDGFQITLLPQRPGDGIRLAEITASAVGKPGEPLLSWRVAALTEVAP